MLDAQELLQLQNDAYQATCDLPCVVTRATRTSRASGGGGTTWNTVPQPNFPNGLLAGLAQPTAGQLTNYGYLIGALSAWQAKLPVGAIVQEQDRLIISGETLDVKKDLTPRSYPVLITVLVTEVK